MPASNPYRPKEAFALLLLLATGLGCASLGQKWMGFINGPLNDPSNRTLRREILAYGLKEFCNEMRVRSAPLTLSPGAPSVGRFFPESCTRRDMPNGDMLVEFRGRGYGWTNVSRKTAFSMSGAVEYDQDFVMDGNTMYALFRTRQVPSSNFHVDVIEIQLAAMLNQLAPIGDGFGRQLVDAKLREGFTVIRDPNGNADFAIGILRPGQRPTMPVHVRGTDRIAYESGRSEVHQNQRDFIGPVTIKESGRALFITAQLEGAPAADLLVLRGIDGRAALDAYMAAPAAQPITAQPIAADPVLGGATYRRALPLPEGTYWVVLDNTPTAGPTSPPYNAFDDRAAAFAYAVQVGDAP